MLTGPTGKVYRAKGRHLYPEPALPNEKRAQSGDGRLSVGWWDVTAFDLQFVLDGRYPRGLQGDWRTARAPAMRRAEGVRGKWPGGSERMGMTLEQGGYGPGQYDYERKTLGQPELDHASGAGGLMLRDALIDDALDAGLAGNPNRGACREKKFGLDDRWTQRLWLEKWEHESVSGVQYFLLCPGCGGDAARARREVIGRADQPVPDAWPPGSGSASALRERGDDEAAWIDPLSKSPRLSRVGRKGLAGLTGTTSNCGDGSRGAHGGGWVCGQKVYKLFWVLARPGEVRDAMIGERWIAGLSSTQLTRHAASVSALIHRYGPIMGVRALRCRRCLRLRYGQSPQVLRKKRQRSAGVEARRRTRN